MRKNLSFILLFVSSLAFSQNLTVTGTVEDSTSKTPLPFAVVMAVKFKDSTLVAFTRTDKNGFFKLHDFPADTFQILITHPYFGDKIFYVFGSAENNSFDFGKFNLPPKSIDIKEIVIYAFKDPVYYKGDTLIYTTDSFKVKPNATVEDLLKKLPGIKVDAQGKITAGGKQVDQVLVDGDEFFGSDQTIATRNLNAANIQSVQIFDKTNENPSAEGGDEPLKVMNLKLKEDAKKGYFGKVSGGTDLSKFYEGEVLANKFKGTEKISGFGLTSNTPNNNLNWNDMYQYGLMGDAYHYNEDDGEDNSYYYSGDYRNPGIPQVFKSGIYYTNKFGKKTKLTANYTYNSFMVRKESETNSQYFLADTTYSTINLSESVRKSETHSANIAITESVDSLTDINWQAKIYFSPTVQESKSVTQFFSESDSLARSTDINNYDKSDFINLVNTLKLTRRFKKKERLFTTNYSYSINDSHSDGILKSFGYNSVAQSSADTIDQEKINASRNQSHAFAAVFAEPISKKIKLEFSYDINYNFINQEKEALDFVNGEYSQKNFQFTNNFVTKRITNRAGLKFIYEVKKQKFTIGSRFRQIEMNNTDLEFQNTLNQSVINVLPYTYYSYLFSSNKRLNVQYITSSSLPNINQLQPIPDNTNPNYVNLGNPELAPSFKHQARLMYYSYKPISGSYTNASVNFSSVHNDFSNSIHYDSIGRIISQPININGNYSAYSYLSKSVHLFSSVLKLRPNLDLGYWKRSSFVNDKRSTTTNSNLNTGLDLSLEVGIIDFTIGGSYGYNIPFSALNSASNQPYSSQEYSAELYLELPKKFKIQSDADYILNDRLTQGYNLNYLTWNVSVNKTLLKKENLILSFSGSDILNQNKNVYRSIKDNVITDTRANIIGRYFLLKVIFKFNSNNKNESSNE